MEREMRRRRQQLGREECERIMRKMTAGVLAICGADGWPYAVPLSFVYDGGKIYFHSAAKGHKLEVLAENPRVSFCVVEKDDVVPEEFTTYFRSVIAFGTARVITDGGEKLAALRLLADKYSPGDTRRREEEIAKGLGHLVMVEISVERMTGKEAIELRRASS